MSGMDRVFQSRNPEAAASETTFGVFTTCASSAGPPADVEIGGDAKFSIVASVAVGRVPAAIPASQAYYWSRAWQAGETEAEADLAAGRSRVFDDPAELARYLLSAE